MANRIYQLKIIKNIEVRPKYYKISLSCLPIAKSAEPGQFLNLKVSNSNEPLLRRPFSIHRISHKVTKSQSHKSKSKKTYNLIEILYEVVGQGTEILSQRKQGEYLDVIGPLGKGFDYSAPVLQRSSAPVLVAGGMGVAPLVFLAQKLKEGNTQYAIRNTLVLIGAKTKTQILCEKEFKELGCEVKIATDDGSRGFKGKVTDLLKYRLSTIDYRLSTIYACGPRPMLKEIALISKQYKIPAQVSLEEHMACGIGACLGCAVNTKEGYKRVCKEGPVFPADEIVW